MKFNLDAVKTQDGQHEQIDPKDIFKSLPKKNRKYSYLRDVQAEVLEKWFQIKEENEIVIKMNTGSGKTIVSLLILQSCMNQDYGPVAYVVPDNYLLMQVEKEAEQLGLHITKDPRDVSFLKQKSILLINIHKLFNGKSVFGVGDEGIKIDLGTVLIDDAHACIDKVEEQFTISIEKDDQKYKELLELFLSDLMQQSKTKTADITIQTPGTFIQLPFWTIQSKYVEIIKVLSDDLENNELLKWKLPLLKNYFKYCDCVVSSERIEISIRVIPTEIINSYENAKKIITSATLPDDTILRRYLNISEKSIMDTITPKTASDLGERLIIVPEEINPYIKKDEIKELIFNFSKQYKIVIVVPSKYRSEYWADIADKILLAENIEKGLEDFRSQSTGIAILVNKYDGIDLPDDDCRILILDELPDDRSEIEKVDTNILSKYNHSLLRKVRKIEQGMGRAIRSNEDYSVVFLLGKSLTNFLFAKGGMDVFTPATKKQLKISSDLLEQIHKGSIRDIHDAVDLVLSRNESWVSTIKSSLIGLTFSPQIPNKMSFSLRDSYEFAWIDQYNKAVEVLEECANNNREKTINGWLKYYIAMMQNFSDGSASQMTLKSALSRNSKVVRPIEGVQYQKIITAIDQAEKCKEYLNNYSSKPNELLITLNAILEDLIFRPETAEHFENAIMDIGLMIGFISQRPERETGRGPDNLWICGNLKFFIIECKNGCTSKTINKHDTNQINGSIVWFDTEYDDSCNSTPILIHPELTFEHAASPNQNIRIMNREKLNEFKEAVRKFIVAAISTGQIAELSKIRQLLRDNNLLPDLIKDKYTIRI